MRTSSASWPSSPPDGQRTRGAGTRGAGSRAAIRVATLVKRYGGRTVIDGVDLEVGQGELVALLGPNGAGKTTLVEIIEGYRRADGGTVEVLGRDPWRAPSTHRARVGLMLQEGGVDPRARPLEVLRLYASLYADARDPEAVLDEVGLRAVAATRYRRVSGGEKQRLALGLALIGRPELLVLDEPTAGMDPAARAATRDLIAGLRKAGVTILLTTHDLGDVERLADRVAVLDRGRIVALGTPAELSSDGRSVVRLRLGGDVQPASLARLRLALEARLPGSTLEIEGPASDGRLRIAAGAISPATIAGVAAACADAGTLITELRAGGGSLEDRYLELTGDRAVSGGSADAAP
jgi:ABC-2 type transport system ATP-binding protein